MVFPALNPPPLLLLLKGTCFFYPHFLFYLSESTIRTPDVTVRKRNRVEDLLDNDPPSRPPTHIQPSSRTGLHSEDMTSLLYAAEIKQQEREFQVVRRAPAPPTSISSSSSPDSSPSPPHRHLLPSIHNGFGSPEPNFANLQGLLSFLEDVKVKHRPWYAKARTLYSQY